MYANSTVTSIKTTFPPRPKQHWQVSSQVQLLAAQKADEVGQPSLVRDETESECGLSNPPSSTLQHPVADEWAPSVAPANTTTTTFMQHTVSSLSCQLLSTASSTLAGHFPEPFQPGGVTARLDAWPPAAGR